MLRPAIIRRSWILLLFLGIWLCHSWVSAQEGVFIHIPELNVDQFPTISMTLSIVDNSGRHVANLNTQNFTMIEDGEAIQVDTVAEITSGTQQIFLLNTSRGLRGRDALGLTRYDYIRTALIDWWAKMDAAIFGVDDLNLMSVDGNLVMHSSSTAQLASAISSYEPQFENEFASFDLLIQAFDITADSSTRLGKPSIIFFITPLITETQEFPLANTITWAKENEVTIYPILVGPEEVTVYPEIDNLELLAETTGGELIFFNPEEGLNTLADRIITRRKQYEISYTSKANSSGSHNLQVRVISTSLDVLSDPTSFPLNISIPEVIFIQPPNKITRETQDPAQPLETISPTSTNLQISILFPDGHPRSIVSSQLIVDDQRITVHTEPPFENFEWDISKFQESGTHEIKVLVEDSLGLQASTVTLPISLEVIIPPRNITSIDPGLKTALIIIGVVSIAGLIGYSTYAIGKRRKIQPSPPPQKARVKPEQRQSLHFLRKVDRDMVEAILEPIAGQTSPIALLGVDLMLGRDASISAAYIDDPSVSAIHARIIRLASGEYLIRDQGSVAGTWVNYQAIPEKGKILHHGDLVHLGRVIFRFTMMTPPPKKPFQIETLDPNRFGYGIQEKRTQESRDE